MNFSVLGSIYMYIKYNTHMMIKEKDVILPIRIKRELKNEFKSHCDKKGYSLNKRIKILIEEDIQNEKVNNK